MSVRCYELTSLWYRLAINTMHFHRHYSELTAWIAFSFSLYGVLQIYIDGSLLWMLLAISLIIAFLSIILGFKSVLKIFYIPLVPIWIHKSSIIFLRLGFFISSVFGFLAFLYHLPVKDKSVFLVPIVICVLFFTGVVIGIFNDERKWTHL